MEESNFYSQKINACQRKKWIKYYIADYIGDYIGDNSSDDK